jgi:hypothetical protein
MVVVMVDMLEVMMTLLAFGALQFLLVVAVATRHALQLLQAFVEQLLHGHYAVGHG